MLEAPPTHRPLLNGRPIPLKGGGKMHGIATKFALPLEGGG